MSKYLGFVVVYRIVSIKRMFPLPLVVIFHCILFTVYFTSVSILNFHPFPFNAHAQTQRLSHYSPTDETVSFTPSTHTHYSYIPPAVSSSTCPPSKGHHPTAHPSSASSIPTSTGNNALINPSILDHHRPNKNKHHSKNISLNNGFLE